MNDTDDWMGEPLNHVVGALLDKERGLAKELSNQLGLKGTTTVSHGRSRPGAFKKHRAKIAEFFGMTVAELADLAKANAAPDFERRVDDIYAVMRSKRDRVRWHKNVRIVALARDAQQHVAGRFAVVSMMAPEDKALVCYLAPDGWRVGTYLRTTDGVVVTQAGRPAQYWPAETAPEIAPLLLVGERPGDREIV